jgi:hypothetical protein
VSGDRSRIVTKGRCEIITEELARARPLEKLGIEDVKRFPPFNSESESTPKSIHHMIDLHELICI